MSGTVLLLVVLLATQSLAAQLPDGSRISLVLSGGGARGLAHVGVLKALEEEGVTIGSISATSMGALVGGLYACGYSAIQIDSLIRNTDWDHLFSSTPEDRLTLLPTRMTAVPNLLTLSLDGLRPVLPLSAVSTQRVGSLLSSLAGPAQIVRGTSFDSLPIPLRVIAFDISVRKRVIHSSGDLALCMLSSMSIPAVFPAVRMGSLLLVDGGTVDNIPVDVAAKTWPYPVLAIDTSSPPGEVPEELPSLIQVGTLTYSALSGMVNSRFWAEPEWYFRPDLHDSKAWNFSQVDSLIDWGYAQAISWLAEHPEIPRGGAAHFSWHPPHLTCRNVLFEGLGSVSHSAVFPWTTLNRGDAVTPSSLRHSAENLYASQLFNRVYYSLSKADEEGSVNILYSFEERDPASIGFGLDYHNEFGLDARLTLEHRNFLNTGSTFLLNAGGGEGYLFAETEFLNLSQSNWFSRLNLSTFQIKGSEYDAGGYSSERLWNETAGRLSRGVAIGWFGLVEAGIGGRLHGYGDGPVTGFPEVFLRDLLVTEDDYVNPQSGSRIDLELSGTPVGNVRHMRFALDARTSFRLSSQGVLRVSGWSQLLTGKTLEWQYSRMLAGRSIPGFPWNSLPSRCRIAGSAAYTRFVTGPLFIRVETGYSWDFESPSDIGEGDLRSGLGISAGVSTHIGPAMLTLARPDEGGHRWTVSLGALTTFGPGR
jgi:predicted acylesterase/phospholipase RssA